VTGKLSRLALLAGGLVFAGAAPAWAAAGARHTVAIEAMQFAPATLEVKVGDTVTWQNKDPFPHNVRSADGQLRSPDFQAGASWTFKARKKGTFPYVCTLHPSMKAVLVVR
jgi:plastocyanin